jgi:hypothetical protein
MSIVTGHNDREKNEKMPDYEKRSECDLLSDLSQDFTDRQLLIVAIVPTIFTPIGDKMKVNKGTHIAAAFGVVKDGQFYVSEENVVGKLPGKSIKKVGDGINLQGEKLVDQAYQSEAVFQKEINLSSTFSPRDNLVAPEIFYILDTERLEINIQDILSRSQAAQLEGQPYDRMNNACGNHIYDVFTDEVNVGPLSTQNAGFLTCAKILKATGNEVLLAEFHKDVQNLKINEHPSKTSFVQVEKLEQESDSKNQSGGPKL